MNWHELKDGRSIAVDTETFYVKAKEPFAAEIKQTMLFYPKKTIFFQIDDRKTSVQFDGHLYHFETQEKRSAFIESVKKYFPNNEEVGVRGMIKYPYKPQTIALIILNICFWTGMYASSPLEHLPTGRRYHLIPEGFIDLLIAIPHTVLISAYILFSAAVIVRINQTSQRLEHETIIRITQN